jgi:thiamine biosynthesis lipoprotein
MTTDFKHSRRAFLQGRAAARLLADKAAAWMEKTGALPTPPERALSERGEKSTSIHLLASRRAMACDFQVQYHAADGSEATEAMVTALDIVGAVEEQLTVYRDMSDVVTINAHAGLGPVVVEKRLFELFQLSRRLCLETDHAFDITSGPLSRVWGFLQRAGRLPSEAEIAAARNGVGIDRWQLDPEEQTITLESAEVEVNFNAIGKGYALDQAAQWLATQGVNDYLWHGGRSSVLARGRNRAAADQRAGYGQHTKENNDLKREGWTVGLPHPIEPNRRLAEFYLHDTALATAGSMTQFFERKGTCYGHLIDPRTGWPADKVITATVLGPTAAEADALSTAFYIMGTEQTDHYCRRHPQVKSVLVCPGKLEKTIMIHAFGMAPGDWTVLE